MKRKMLSSFLFFSISTKYFCKLFHYICQQKFSLVLVTTRKKTLQLFKCSNFFWIICTKDYLYVLTFRKTGYFFFKFSLTDIKIFMHLTSKRKSFREKFFTELKLVNKLLFETLLLFTWNVQFKILFMHDIKTSSDKKKILYKSFIIQRKLMSIHF